MRLSATLLTALLFALRLCHVTCNAAEALKIDGRKLSAVLGPAKCFGAWWAPPLLANVADRMQAIHIVLLPSRKVLIVNGSSNRNRIEKGKIREGVNCWDYAVVNNTSLFDPSAPPDQSGLTRISSPPSPIAVVVPEAKSAGAQWQFLPNDLFCSGHLHLPDGNVLFAGGTQNYYPGGKFLGSRVANLFDWKTEQWRPAGIMTDGHWYPSLVPLGDGRIMVISGLSSKSFSNSTLVEFYNYMAPAGSEWTAVDIQDLPNGPFKTQVEVENPLPMTPSHGSGSEHSSRQGADAMDHYPRIAPLPDGRLLITGDGTGGGNVDSKYTYLMSIGANTGQNGTPSISFVRGPERSRLRKTFGTAFLDPNPNVAPGSYFLIGGLAGSADIDIGPASPPRDPRINVVGSAERYWPPSTSQPEDVGSWSFYEHFLGDRPNDIRIMHVGVLLPTKQVLLIGGGYNDASPIFSPLLLTPDPKAISGYSVRTMNPGQQPRLYHTSALLLPDARVFLAGGNASRAARDAITGDVRLLPDGTYSYGEKGSNVISSEIYQIEIFYPPYLFIEGTRPTIVEAPDNLSYGETAEIRLTDATPDASVVLIKLGSMTHAWDMGQRLAELKFTQSAPNGAVAATVTAPENRNLYPPGYYMLFYVNGKGKPSEAAIVRLH
jgi:hypothetical protein